MKKVVKRLKTFGCFAVFIAAVSCALSVTIAAQPNEKQEKANVIFAEAQRLADVGTDESWKAAEAKFEDAFALFIESAASEKKQQVIHNVGVGLRTIAKRHLDAQRFSIARNYYIFALAKVRDAGLKADTASCLHNLGFIAENEGKPVLAVVYYKQALPLYIEVGDTARTAIIYRNLGLLEQAAKKYDAAITFFEQSLKLKHALKDGGGEAELLIDIGDVYLERDYYIKAGDFFQQALAVSTGSKDVAHEAEAWVRLGTAKYLLYKNEEAIQYFQAGLSYYRSTNDLSNEADALLRLGKVYLVINRIDESREALNGSAEIYSGLKIIQGEGEAIYYLGNLELSFGNIDSAKSNYEKARDLFKTANNQRGVATATLGLGQAYSYLNDPVNAFQNINLAKPIFEAIQYKAGIEEVFMALGWTNHTISRFDEAIRNTSIALKMAEEMGDSRRRSDAHINLGVTYSALGQVDEAIKQYNLALDLTRDSDNKYNEAIALSNLGYSYFRLDELTKSKQYLNEAIAKMRLQKMKREEGYATHNLGLVDKKVGDYKSAMRNYEAALKIYIEVKDRRPEAFLYNSFGEVYLDQKQWDKAAFYLEKSLILAREIRYSEVEASALNNMTTLWLRRSQPRLAVLYGKQAVNIHQTVRGENRGLEKSALTSYLKSNERIYRDLADILVSLGRLPEAQQVLDLLKEEEFFAFVRRDAAEAVDQAKLALTDSERKALDEYSRLSVQLTSLGSRFQVLQNARKKANGKLSQAEEAEFQTLKGQIEEAGIGVRAFLTKLSTEFSKTVEDKVVITPQSIVALQADLRRAGKDVVLVSTYLLPERYRAIVTTGNTMVDRKVEYKDRKLTGDDVKRKIDKFRKALQNSHVDPRPLGKELYDIFVKPLEKDLRGAGAKTILWSLDGSLRYIPIAALSPDGQTYLAEQYQNVIVTLARQTNLFANPSTAEWRAIGAGVSKPHDGFSELPSVIAEIDSIVRESGTSKGVLDGKKLLDEKFDLEAFRNAIPQETDDGKIFNIIHLATHFKLGLNYQDSALLLGDGKRLSLYAIDKDVSLDFKDIELLALSACETGVSAGDDSGREVESLGMLAQKKGAKAVLATLWKVADEGTSMFMSEFYRLKKENPQMSKSEAIRLTQKAMIDGKIKSSGIGGGCRADTFVQASKENDFKCDPNAPFSHPYFWSPFVLIGNWK